MSTPVLDPITTTKNESLNITIDQVNRLVTTNLVPGDKTAVTFHSDEDCVVHFLNRAVFDTEFLLLTHGVSCTKKVISSGEKTEVKFFLPAAVSRQVKPWPILP